MSESHSETRNFFLDDEPLGSSYDDESDVLYLWLGSQPAEGIGLTTDNGVVIRLDPKSGELVGFTILDFWARFAETDVIEVSIPAVGAQQPQNGAGTTKRRVLAATA